MKKLLSNIKTAITEEETRTAIEAARANGITEDVIVAILEERAAQIASHKELAEKFGGEDPLYPDYTEEEISIIDDGCYLATIIRAIPSKDKSVVQITFAIGREHVEQSVKSEWYAKAVRSVNSALNKKYHSFKEMVTAVKNSELEIPVQVKTNKSWTNIYFLDEIQITSFDENRRVFSEEDEW